MVSPRPGKPFGGRRRRKRDRTACGLKPEPPPETARTSKLAHFADFTNRLQFSETIEAQSPVGSTQVLTWHRYRYFANPHRRKTSAGRRSGSASGLRRCCF